MGLTFQKINAYFISFFYLFFNGDALRNVIESEIELQTFNLKIQFISMGIQSFKISFCFKSDLNPLDASQSTN